MIGIDEVGRGAWAGPLVVAGCMFINNPGFIKDLNDSKKLSRLQRTAIAEHIKSDCLYAFGVIDADFIDAYGLSAALRAATLQVVNQLPESGKIVIDGSVNFLSGTVHAGRVETIVKADASQPSVMAASVIAKVYRDELMAHLAELYPEYGFARHVGYGTKAHKAALEQYGVLPIHRKSFRPIRDLM